MGLAIARGIVEAHDGRILVEGGAGEQDTRVTFTVPVGDEEQASAENQSAGRLASTLPGEVRAATSANDG